MITMKAKRLLLIAITTLLAVSIIGCSNSNSNSGEEDTVLQYQGAPGNVLIPELAEALGYFKTIKLEKVSDYVGGPESIQYTATGETDFGLAFNGAILKSYAKGIKVKAVVAAAGT